MTKPKFANTSSPAPTRRPKVEGYQEEIILEQVPSTKSNELPTISEFMNQQMQTKLREPTRPITLRFEDTLWQKVEDMRGNLSKNDFFKELVHYYDQHRSHEL